MSGTRLKMYDKTMTDAGVEMTNVMMNQFGQIFEKKSRPAYYPSGKRKGKDSYEWEPTGRCGCANH